MSGRLSVAMVVTLAWALAPGTAGGAEAKQEPPPARPTVAVLDYQVTAPDNVELGSQIADILTARLSVEDAFDLVERAKLGQIIKEHKLTLSGLTNQDQAARIGKLLGAQLMIVGKAFMMDKQLTIVTKVIGVETGRVKGTIRTIDSSKPLSEAIMLLAEDVAALIRKDAARLLPAETKLADPIAEIRKALGDAPRPVVAVVITETHRTRVVVDPAVETEIKRTLILCGFKVVDTGMNALADWARHMMKGKRGPWPAATRKADLVVVGEAFSEFALRTGDLVTCTARAEINLIDRHTGEIVLADRETSRAVDLAEVTAGKTALQKAGRKLAIRICKRLARYTKSSGAGARKNPGPAAGQSLALTRPARILAAPREVPQPPAETKSGPRTAKRAERTIFAAPLDNETGEEQYDPAGAGIGDLVAVLLAQQEHITVVERQWLLALTAEQARSLKGLTGERHALKAGRLLEADTVLTGRLYLVKDKLTVYVKAVDIASERVVAAAEISCRPEYLAEAALQTARELGKQMALPLPEIDLEEIDKSPIASLHFAKALAHYYAGNMDAAVMQFMRTMDLDPDYVEAHFWTGICHQRLGEDAHAIIEWEKFLVRRPDGERAEAVKKLIAEAKAREATSGVKRLGPEAESTGGNK